MTDDAASHDETIDPDDLSHLSVMLPEFCEAIGEEHEWAEAVMVGERQEDGSVLISVTTCLKCLCSVELSWGMIGGIEGTYRDTEYEGEID
jgi:hypothetical protein